MRKDYSSIDMFRYVKFLEENPHLKNNINAMEEYDKEYPKLTAKENLNNLKSFLNLKQ